MLETYPSDGINVEIRALNGYAFQLSNSLSQILSNDSLFSNIDLGECEAQLKARYNLPSNISLIFFKFENIGSTNGQRDIQYEVYNPLTYEKLNLSICQDLKININVPLELSDEVIALINNIIEQGYNPFDLNDKFYREICTPYNSENGTDVLLDDREEYIYSTIVNETSCPSGCTSSSYSLDSKYITCECDANDTGIVALDLDHISTSNVASSFLSTLKNSNYKVMRCYNLVFNFKIFCHNYGSIITLIFFVIYVLFMIYYCCKGISPIKVSVSKIRFEEEKKEDNIPNPINQYLFQAKSTKERKINSKSVKSSKSNKKKRNKKIKESYPPKKGRVLKTKKNSFDEGKGENQIRLIDIVKKKRHSIKNRSQKENDESVKSDNGRRRKSIIDYMAQQENILKTRENLLNGDTKRSKNANIDTIYSNRKLRPNEKNDENKNPEEYDDYELNNMDYNDASEFDKRTCLRTYWSVLKREHYVLFTFISRNDYNLFYVKIERFFILICTEMTMNGMFFVHETMYKKKTGDTSFAQRIPQIIFSLLVSHAMEIILCYLSMTDVNYYEIKALPKIKKNDERVFDILDCINRKLTGFFIFTFLVFLFHWYFISAFCAVYQNTQKIFLRDSAISILMSLIDPFIIYGITCLLRAISLSLCCRKKLWCIYKLSDLIPFF